MSDIVSTFRRDANRVPITTLGFINSKTIEFDGTTGKGATGATTLFTVTGDVAVNVFAICSEDLASAGGTVEIGITASTACLADQQTATNIDNNDVWHNGVLSLGGAVTNHFHPVKQSVILTVAGAAVSNGTLTFYCLWTPLSSDANLETA